ncbi:prostaglandin G/H synthase 2-like [Physella acuta]|uniref:prostaglandin G/H synthase 2-like n=1 Tax=Physella acuta TaxID=109671 RepID=UPI0027DADFC4|nr:prostaglandin G/H synthase 2-like [Physella acuta]XP_059141343.1 prostaglandin G/H synthase 2-like [Physella acuta]XP_059141344.1 prostaglandin G/H synthase 2-like [Physella acuta]XP_059141345.1 prostaglandin G/H synthase 2-like [Physella acuta]
MKSMELFLSILALTLLSCSAENPCCSFPCQNKGICLTGREPGSYTCDCGNSDFYGPHCETPTLTKRLKLFLRPSSETLHNWLVSPSLKWIWDIINNVEFLHNYVLKRIYLLRSNVVDSPALYETEHAYPTIGAFLNKTYYARTLPPVPLECPTPMGVKGPKELPDVNLLVEKFFTRTKFRPEPMGTSVLMAFFAQHFTHMFFKTDYTKGVGYTWGGHGVDVSSIYGKDTEVELWLRSGVDGKLKMQTVNNEEYPMYNKDVPVKMTYAPNVPEHHRFAMGHPFYGLLPGLFLYQTIWMREHNRVCDILKGEHPDWDDERLFQTGKLIILGETLKIVVEDYVQHLANYNIEIKFKPTVLFGEHFQYQNKINAEFNDLYHWHPLMPDEFNISGTIYPMKDFMFHSELVLKHGTASFTESLSRQRAGHMSHHNHGPSTIGVVRDTILHGRKLRYQSLNNYRRRFNLEPYESFEDLTGEKEMAAELEKLYLDIEAVEFYVGILVEKRRVKNLFGSTIVEIGGPFSVKGLMSNPICSRHYWKPSTFGGEVGFNIIKTATLKSLFCNNIKGPCPLVTFRVPDFKEGDVDELNNFRLKTEL